jgi:hypothetical protein
MHPILRRHHSNPIVLSSAAILNVVSGITVSADGMQAGLLIDNVVVSSDAEKVGVVEGFRLILQEMTQILEIIDEEVVQHGGEGIRFGVESDPSKGKSIILHLETAKYAEYVVDDGTSMGFHHRVDLFPHSRPRLHFYCLVPDT